MTVLGVDYAWGRPQPGHIAAAGYKFVLRYLSNDAGKSLTHSEAQALLAVGLDIGVVWETTADRALSGAVGGSADGARAKVQADVAGAPAGSAIYFAVDFDAQLAQMPTIDAYAVAFAAAVAPHPAGVYGGLAACNHLARLPYRWQTAAWSHGQRAVGVCLFQRIGQALIDGVGCDVNEQLGPFGGWRTVPAPPPMPAPPPPSTVTTEDDPMLIIWHDNEAYLLAQGKLSYIAGPNDLAGLKAAGAREVPAVSDDEWGILTRAYGPVVV